MQTECQWDSGRLLNFVRPDPAAVKPVLSPGGQDLFGGCDDADGRAPMTRDLLSLTLPLSCRLPDLAFSTLTAVTAEQNACGSLPENLGGPAPTDLGADVCELRSDNEIWLLTAWVFFICQHGRQDLLDTLCPFADGGDDSVWEHLKRTYLWLRDELRQGRHGLLRILDGDWNGYLNEVGREGRGESVLNTAMACYALQRFGDLARKRDDNVLAEEVGEWTTVLRMAVGESFDGEFFRRAYTDAGRPVGSLAGGRIFTDVQAWAVLARCGTAMQREKALTSVLESCPKPRDLPVPVMSKPYGLSAPTDVSTCRRLPGHGMNGGCALPEAAWLVWALATEGRREVALQEWQRLCIAYRCASGNGGTLPHVANCAQPASPVAGERAGFSPLDQLRNREMLLPQAHAVAWQEFALHVM